MQRSERYTAFINYFSTHQPDPKSELLYATPFQLLVAVILSAQCTDKRVNQVTRTLFAHYPNPKSMANATLKAIYTDIQTISYPHNKAKYLRATAKIIEDDYQGKLPTSVAKLQALPGVGRKTAHVVASTLYRTPVLPVDTHVYRVAKRIGLAPQNARTPLAVERTLTRHLPDRYIPQAHHWLVLHGRYICQARKPQCPACPIQKICRYKQQKGLLEQIKIKKLKNH